MREHAHLPAMVSFVRKHVAEHFQANWHWPSPAVALKILDATVAERLIEHLHAASGALRQGRTGLLRRAVRAVELGWHLQVRCRQPDPLSPDIVHMSEDRRNRAGLTRGFGSPGGRVKIFDKKLVYAIVGGKGLDCGPAELGVNLGLTRSHGSCSLPYHTYSERFYTARDAQPQPTCIRDEGSCHMALPSDRTLQHGTAPGFTCPRDLL
jgi:hypothetical protein